MSLSPRHATPIILGIIFTFYCFFQARFIIWGPSVTIESHQNGEVTTSSVVVLFGRAKNAAWLSLNGRQIFTDEKGFWSEKLLLADGESIMRVLVRDRFGRESEETKRIIYYAQK